MANQAASNPLLSAQKPAPPSSQVVLHPLPILEISDYIARAYNRGFKGAIVGALLGRQRGNVRTIEYSFTCRSSKGENGLYTLDWDWFTARLNQFELVHRNPDLELVGWYTLTPKTGPFPAHLPIHSQISGVQERPILLGFHVDDVLSPITGDRLPLTIYESIMETTETATSAKQDQTQDQDKEMTDAETPASKTTLRFREVPYTMETFEDEMIALQYVREGPANAAATVGQTEKIVFEQFDKTIAIDDGGKGKRRRVAVEKIEGSSGTTTASGESSTATKSTEEIGSADANLTKAEGELLTALQTKYNATKMLRSRIDLIITYLQSLPPDFVNGRQPSAAEPAAAVKASGDEKYVLPSNSILRQIQALVTNLQLVTPAQQVGLKEELQREAKDVNLVLLIADVAKGLDELREAGKKFSVIETAKLRGKNIPGATDVYSSMLAEQYEMYEARTGGSPEVA